MKRALMAILGIILLIISPVASFASDCGDVNNSGSVNILDATYLISYLYKGGPAPNCGLETGTVRDIEGNTYVTVKIGNRWWMAENLKVTHYRNGDPITKVTDPGFWSGTTAGAYCEYNNDIASVPDYGRLYNWYAVIDFRNICPEGWHIPNDAELQTLADFLGGDPVAGGKMKEAGTVHWLSPNTGATNESGFNGLPAGYRDMYGSYYFMGYFAYFWSNAELDGNMAWFRALYYNYSLFDRDYRNKHSGYSVRCVKD